MVGARLALTDGSGPHLSWPPLSCGSEIYGSGTRDRTTDSPDVISRTGRRSRRRAQPGASPVTRQANCQYRAVRTSGHRTPSSPGNEKVGLTSAMWCQKAQTQPSRRVLNYAHTAYLCGIREGDRRGSNPRPSKPQSDVVRYSTSWCVRIFGLFSGFSAILKTTFVRCILPCTSPVAVRLQYG